jgi:hypothetical protein
MSANRTSNRTPRGESPVPGAIIVIAIVVLVLIVIWMVRQPSIAAHPRGPTSQQSRLLDFSNVTVTPAGGKFNVECKATNKTDEPITGITVDVGFENLTGKTLEKVESTATNADGSALSTHPIAPHETRPIQITVTHAPAGWNESAPDLSLVNVDHTPASSAAQGPKR